MNESSSCERAELSDVFRVMCGFLNAGLGPDYDRASLLTNGAAGGFHSSSGRLRRREMNARPRLQSGSRRQPRESALTANGTNDRQRVQYNVAPERMPPIPDDRMSA